MKGALWKGLLPGGLGIGWRAVSIMAPRTPKPHGESPDPELGDISARLNDLGHRIAAEKQERAESVKPPASYGDATGYAKGYRLVSEFVAGTLVGGLIGYGVDWVFGTLPIFLIVFLLLGFGAGMLNMARAANRVSPAQGSSANPPPKAAYDDEEED
jgi:ATP synthase protein I